MSEIEGNRVSEIIVTIEDMREIIVASGSVVALNEFNRMVEEGLITDCSLPYEMQFLTDDSEERS